MKSILKKVKGGLTLAAMPGLLIAGSIEFGTGFGLGFSHMLRGDEFQPFYQNEQVQEIVQKTLTDEKEALEERLVNGEITESEYGRLNYKLNDGLHEQALAEKVADDIFANDAEYQGIVKMYAKMKTASIILVAIGGFSVLIDALLYVLGVGEKLSDMGKDALREGNLLSVIEKEKKITQSVKKLVEKQNKKYQEELDSYNEEVLT